MNIQILDKTSDYLVCFKPAGLAVQTRKLTEQDLEGLLKKQVGGYIGIVHRLDQPVEGLLLIARNASAAAFFSESSRNRQMNKTYLAEVAVTPDKESDVLNDTLRKEPRGNYSEVVPEGTPGGKRSSLSYRTRKDLAPDRTLLEITLETGRHHQIRVQLAHMGCPIYGDKKYNPMGNPGPLRLCACRLEFWDPDGAHRKYEIKPTWL